MKYITIIGGQKKWYKAVTDDLNLELIHDGGEHPKRILGKLKRSKAIFLVLTATSHNATYMCVEYAKELGIPCFKLKGCKSQLRELILQLDH
ncbi:hypothetical protein BC351_10470 [Paenibacillus ferrarius]|uniref:DUF2325 domain-containing protein n=1 Tax=Paenibacillus ferrarius TaxID=1469647 RepID=A0A1V4HA55_9BACL|nr:hypothetical protein BC351_10470 [Paenibacillus ferrarius]